MRGGRKATGRKGARSKSRAASARASSARATPRSKARGDSRRPERRRRLPYVRRLERRGPLDVWLVDGSYVRKNIDEEFSNFGHHYSFTEIPEAEIWLDHESDPNELKFFIRHAVLERRLVKQGKSYEAARRAANAAERKMRMEAGDLRRVVEGKSLPKAERVHERLWKKLPNGVSVWFVNGRLVRSAFDIEFTEGGHEHVYEYVPRGEVWIDDDIHDDELAFVLFHELHERGLMANGMDYDRAHEEASRLERYYRNHPAELHQALADEGWE